MGIEKFTITVFKTITEENISLSRNHYISNTLFLTPET